MSVPERREDLALVLRAALTSTDEPAKVWFVPPAPATPPVSLARRAVRRLLGPGLMTKDQCSYRDVRP